VKISVKKREGSSEDYELQHQIRNQSNLSWYIPFIQPFAFVPYASNCGIGVRIRY